jgi:coenzyme Q-binding protein COQ10
MGHLKHSVHIKAPVDKVWDYCEDPHHWPTFMVGMSGPDKVTGDIGVGQQIEYTLLAAGVHMHQTERTVEDRRDPDGSGHWRGEFTGSSSGWDTFDVKPENGGTEVTMEMEYTVPGSVLGKVADRLILERMADRDMLHSLENLKLLMEESSA